MIKINGKKLRKKLEVEEKELEVEEKDKSSEEQVSQERSS